MAKRWKDKHGRAMVRRGLEMPLTLEREVAGVARRYGWSWAQTAREIIATGLADYRAREVAK